MKVKKRIDKAVKFEDLDLGDVFRLVDGDSIYMRIVDIASHSSDSHSSEYVYNNVSLKTGNVYRVDDGTKVVIIDGTFVEGGGE